MSQRRVRQLRPICAIGLVLLVIASPIVGLIGQPNEARATVAPDLVLVITDDMNSDDWRALPHAKTLLEAVFPNYINTDPLCCPSRASIFTGLYPHNHGTWKTDPPEGGWSSFRNRESATIATMLDTAGYRTGLIGKYINNYEPAAGVRPGWDYWYAFGKPHYGGFRAVEGNNQVKSHRYSTDMVTAKATSFIAATSTATPLFAYIAPYAPHSPAEPPRRYSGACKHERMVAMDKPSFGVPIVGGPAYLGGKLTRHDRAQLVRFDRKRQCSLRAVDDLLVAVKRALDARGRPYYLFLASDNGYLLGEHGEDGKTVPYDESTRTVMRGTSGGGAPALTGSDRLVANIDWMATLADLSGAEPPYPTDGRSMFANPGRALVLIEARAVSANERRSSEERSQVLGNRRGMPGYAGMQLATGELYVEYSTGFVEYYTADDPYRLRNARSASPERVAELARLLRSYRDCRGDACP